MLKISSERCLSVLALLLTIAFLTACGVSGASPLSSTATSQSSLSRSTISPSTVQVLAGGSQLFSVQIVGLTPHVPSQGPGFPSEAWTVNGIPGGNSVVGTIDSQGLYSAPATVPNPSSVTVGAVINSVRLASATVTLYELETGQLAVSPSTMQFGNVAVGSNLSQTGTLTAGKSSVTVYNANWNGPGFSITGISFPLTIAAGKTASFTATFAPQTTGTAASTVSFVANSHNPTTQQLTGSGVSDSTPPPTEPKVSLNWSSVPSVEGYYVYRGGQTGGPYTKISALQPAASYIDSTVASGEIYYYVVTSLTVGTGESGYSNQVQAVIPPTP